MAILLGRNNTKQANDPVEKIQAGEERARMRVSYDEFDAPGALTAGDEIKMSKLPKGAFVHECILHNDALGGGTLDVGWDAGGVEVADPDGLYSAVAVTAAGKANLSAGVVGLQKRFDDEVQLSVLVATDTSSAGKIRLSILYSTD